MANYQEMIRLLTETKGAIKVYCRSLQFEVVTNSLWQGHSRIARPALHFSFYKRVLALRRSQRALQGAGCLFLDHNNSFVLSYLRKDPNGGESVLVALNMSGQPRKLRLDLTSNRIAHNSARPVLSSLELSGDSISTTDLILAPFAVLIAAVE